MPDSEQTLTCRCLTSLWGLQPGVGSGSFLNRGPASSECKHNEGGEGAHQRDP